VQLKSVLDAAAFVADMPELEAPVAAAIANEVKKLNDQAVQKATKDLLTAIAGNL
jgi:hypothetical protein